MPTSFRSLLESSLSGEQASEPARKDEDEQNQHHESQTSARVIAPALAVRPGRESADQHEDENDEQNCTDGHMIDLEGS